MDKNSIGLIAVKALRNSFIFGFIGYIICSFFSFHLALGFAVGFFIGIANLFMLYTSVLKCILLSPDRAKRKMMLSYPIRFIMTMLMMGYMVWSAAMSPVTLLAGFIVTLMSMVITVIYMSYRDVEPVGLPLRDI
jgi:hypothetical protein